ncbi:LOW QUALITY PROTEIN: uncharacterized protein LOC114937170 [Nylanderia fulva]|uniref:LOW QUALITY PROTEIN: uncharacterized protein LOC114937170 n=1 Tax=Nylanderia fulva TaxID=613905 RepID=UPI0010FB87ED|nr:LOW QUALITY PROTEIN: uncharacterized protein LOC114937170 [Nylanderia fulva]
MAVRATILVLMITLAVVASAGLLETLLSWDLPEVEARSTTSQSKCLCQTSGCLCCVDLNLTAAIDIGGPVCINLRQKEQNVSLNLSYRDNPVHNATIRIANAANKPTCMNLLLDVAQICARFTSVKQSEIGGYDGCVAIEPVLLDRALATYHMGCFNFHQGVRQVEMPAITETTEPVADTTDDEDDSLNTDELIAAVSASAEQGIAMFTQWLGLNLNPKLNLTGKEPGPQPQYPDHQQRTLDSSRSARNMADDQIRKSDEQFKQLLSAQDNILKGSATIGQSNGMETTFVYSKPTDLMLERNATEETKRKLEAEVAAPQHRVVVPKDSRRGGRAYNIHQHVNEI